MSLILKQISSLGLIHVSDVKSTYGTNYIQYLDYILIKPGIDFGANPQTGIDTESLIKDGRVLTNINDTEDVMFEGKLDLSNKIGYSESVPRLSLVLNKVLVDFKQEDVKIEAGEDSEIVVLQYLLKSIISKMKVLARQSKEETLIKENVKFDLEEFVDDTAGITKRRLISKILASSNMIAVKTRRGPGQYVIANRDTISILSSYESVSYIYQLENSPALAGLKLYVCDDLGDTVIVGRCGEGDEPGIKLVSNEDSLEKNIYFNNTDIAGINIRYALDSFGPNDKCNYMSFDFTRLKNIKQNVEGIN